MSPLPTWTPSEGARIAEALDEAGVEARADGDDIVARPASLLTPGLRERIAKHRDSVLAALRARRIMDMAPRPCTDCAHLEGGAYCRHYQHVMPEPLRPCRCVHFRGTLPWARDA